MEIAATTLVDLGQNQQRERDGKIRFEGLEHLLVSQQWPMVDDEAKHKHINPMPRLELDVTHDAWDVHHARQDPAHSALGTVAIVDWVDTNEADDGELYLWKVID